MAPSPVNRLAGWRARLPGQAGARSRYAKNVQQIFSPLTVHMTHLSDGNSPAYAATHAACYDVFNRTLAGSRWGSVCLSVFKLNGQGKIEKRRPYCFTFTPPNNEKYMVLFIE